MRVMQFMSGHRQGQFKITDSMASVVWLSRDEAEELYRQLAGEFADKNIKQFEAKKEGKVTV